MANLNKVMLIGRLTREPETRVFSNGGKVANFGFAVNNRKKNQATGEWEDEPVFIEVKAFNREKGRQLADHVEQYLHKGHQAYLEGHLTLEQWTSQDGQKRSALKLVLDDLQFLQPRADGIAGGPGRYQPQGSASRMTTAPTPPGGEFDEPPPEPDTFAPPAPSQAEDLPF